MELPLVITKAHTPVELCRWQIKLWNVYWASKSTNDKAHIILFNNVPIERAALHMISFGPPPETILY